MRIENFKSKYVDEPVVILQWEQYQNGRPALYLKTPDGEMAACASVNLPHVDVEGMVAKKKGIFIKNYSENEGILEMLEKAGVVKKTGWRAPSGFVEIDLCEILVPIG